MCVFPILWICDRSKQMNQSRSDCDKCHSNRTQWLTFTNVSIFVHVSNVNSSSENSSPFPFYIKCKMENRKINEFLHLCCRVCLSVENVMVDTTDIVQNFNKTIDELLHANANMKRLNESYNGHPKLICEECFSELLMVAKFREKCAMAEKTLHWLNKTTNSRNGIQFVANELKIVPALESKAMAYANTRHENAIMDENYAYVECVADTIDDSPEYMIIENDETAADSDEEPNDNVRIETSDEIEDENAAAVDRFVELKDDAPDYTSDTSKSVKLKNIMSVAVINHSCAYCGAGFAQANNLLRHMQTHEQSEDISQDELNAKIQIKSDRLFGNSTDDPQQTSVTKTNADGNVVRKRKISKKQHTCQHCSKSFCAQSLLLAHTRTHTGERPFECKLCAKTFKTRGALDLHTRRHSGVKPYRCKECDRGFVESSNLKVHMRTHTGEKPHQCTQCGRGFSRVFLLQIHQRTHTGERPYACDTCNRSFAQQSDLRAHKRIHSGERPHRCTICAKGFIRSSGLTQHMRRHKKTDDNDDEHEPDVVDEIETSKTTGTIELPKNEMAETVEGANVIVCYKTYSGYDESFTEYLKDDDDNSAE